MHFGPETIELLEENTGGNMFHFMTLDLAMIFFVYDTKSKKIDKMNYMKIKSFCASKNTINKMKRQPMEMGENTGK